MNTTPETPTEKRLRRNRERCAAFQVRLKQRMAADPVFAREYADKKNAHTRARRAAGRHTPSHLRCISLDPHYERRRKLMSQYGITLERQGEMIVEQGGLCAVCLLPLDLESNYRSKYAPCLDHDHATGKHRAIIHRVCNVALGQFADDPIVLRRAADYLEKHRKPPEASKCA